MAERNILLTIKYDGTNFCGWQRQPNARTVCGELEETLERALGQPIKIDGTSRTDAGVHALGQRASFKIDSGIPTARIAEVLNDFLAKDRLERVGEIEIVKAEEVPPEFHARYDSKGKRYEYRIFNSEKADIFKRNYSYFVPKPLDIEAMNEAARYLVGEHDFASFQSAGGTPRETTVREIYTAAAEKQGDYVIFTVSGNGFLYNMVRIIVGTLVETGLGKRSPEEMKATIEAADRKAAGHTAPPQGLYLAEVFY